MNFQNTEMSSREIVCKMCHFQLCDPKLTFYCSTFILKASSVILQLNGSLSNYLLQVQTDAVGIAIFLNLMHYVQFPGVPWQHFVNYPSAKCMNFKMVSYSSTYVVILIF
jgi:hypothetical protein